MSGYTAGRSKQFRTPTCRFSYVHQMFQRVAKKDEKTGKPVLNKDGQEVTEQRCSLIFNNTDPRTVFEQAIVEAILASPNLGQNGLQMLKDGLIRLPFLSGSGKEARNAKTGEIKPGLGADKWFIRVATRLEADIRYKNKLIPPKLGTGPDDIKSGDYGFCVVHAFTWFNSLSGHGVSIGVDYLQKTHDGEALGGTGSGVNIDDVYEAVAGTEQLSGVNSGALFGATSDAAPAAVMSGGTDISALFGGR